MADDDLLSLREKPIREAVGKLERLMSQTGRAFLIGAGCSSCAGLPLMGGLTHRILESKSLSRDTQTILVKLQEQFAGAQNANIEDYLSELIDLVAISERRETRNASLTEVRLGSCTYGSQRLRHALDDIKRAICAEIAGARPTETHRRFVRAVHRPMRPGKLSASETVDYLVLNYDTLIESALGLERLAYADGLDGGATGWWCLATLERPGLVARVLKLHGSIDWCAFRDDPLPRRIPLGVAQEALRDSHALIWPASTKYRETQLDPYAQLTQLARQVLRPNLGAQRVLLVCGYSFGDSHINLELDQALRESDGRLTIVAFTSDDEPTGKLKEWQQDASVTDKLLVFAQRGFYHGSQVIHSTVDLQWWKFENIGRLLGGEL